jgi:uncharacterized lipoprotein YajG
MKKILLYLLLSIFLVSCNPQEPEIIDTTPESPLPYNSIYHFSANF